MAAASLFMGPSDPDEKRLPATISISLAFHAGALGLWVYFNQLPKQQQTRILTNVELMVMAKPSPVATASPVPAGRPDTWNFLKMALPSIPKPLDVQPIKAEPKPMAPKVQTLEESRRRMAPSLETLTEKTPDHHLAPMPSLVDAGAKANLPRASRLAEAPRLEDVGARRAPKALIEAAALADEQHGAPRPQGLSTLASAPEPTHRAPSAAPMALPAENTAPVNSSALSRLAQMLPAEQPIGRGDGRSGPLLKPQMDVPAPEKHQAQAMVERKKATTIEGPVQGRRILHAAIPKFPAWAQQQGVLEAAVRIKFTVDPSGKVLEDLQLVQTSGYGELDRLAMDSLKDWLFEPKPESSGIEWGIITFRFVME